MPSQVINLATFRANRLAGANLAGDDAAGRPRVWECSGCLNQTFYIVEGGALHCSNPDCRLPVLSIAHFEVNPE